MSTVEMFGYRWNIPPRGRVGSQIRSTLGAIIDNPGGIALYKAMGLRGRAKSYEGRYRQSFIRFADANNKLLEKGAVGPKGGFGYRLKQSEVK